jgi:hypothetical protein
MVMKTILYLSIFRSIRIGLGFLTFQFIDFMFISRGVGSEISFTNAI